MSADHATELVYTINYWSLGNFASLWFLKVVFLVIRWLIDSSLDWLSKFCYDSLVIKYFITLSESVYMKVTSHEHQCVPDRRQPDRLISCALQQWVLRRPSSWHVESFPIAEYNKYSLLMHCIKIKSPVKFLLNEQYVFVGGNISFLCVLSCSSEEA